MKATFLSDRGVVKVSGDDARDFLGGLFTTNIDQVHPGSARFGALLTPQGKIVVDFLITEAPAGQGGGFLIDCPRALAQALTGKLGFYKLRAKVAVENLSEHLGVLVVWDGTPDPQPVLAFPDPRSDQLGWRMLVAEDSAEKAATAIGAIIATAAEYDLHRIRCGVPRGGSDFIYGDAFPHETNMDRLHGVDFDKGCYVGQEVVSRMEHRGTARTRIVRIALEGATPEQGVDVTAGDKSIGVMGSAAGGAGLALLRIDRAADALENGAVLLAGGIPIRIADIGDLRGGAKKVFA
jgi:folate-binding protein YgfZ